jgi:transcriptional regulator with PAS, ATPase and Fis domain
MPRSPDVPTLPACPPTPPGTGALLDLLPLALFTIGPDGIVTHLNPEAARLTGQDPASVVGRRCSDVFRCLQCDSGCGADVARREGRACRDLPVDLRRADDAALALRMDAAPLGGGHVAVALRDVSEVERLKRSLRDRWVFHGMTGVSAAFKEIVAQVRDVAPYDTTVLVLGESGTGKELVARAIHAESPRAQKPFVTVSCAAYSEGLLESELFGHVRGAFTSADRDRAGRLELADGGTVFLDEIGDVSPKIQVKLLRVLQEREVERVGESRARPVDVRIVAATNRDLHRAVREGRFREDLFYRLNVVTLHLPPLRERRDDLPVLVDFLLRRAAVRIGKEVLSVEPDALARLSAHAWPGNVRELANVLESAVVRARDGVVRVGDLPADLGRASAPEGSTGPGEDERMASALRRAAGSVTLAARLLGVHRTTLWRWMRERNLDRKDFQPI